MTPRDYMEANFRDNPHAKNIKRALELAGAGVEHEAWVIANPIMMKMNAVDRHALSDAIYALLHARPKVRA